MKLALALLLAALSTQARAATPEIDQNLVTLKTALNFVDLDPRDRQKLLAIEDRLEQSIAKSCGGSGAAQFNATCRALGTATGEEKGMGDGSSAANLEAAIANAKDAALSDCMAKATFKSDCEMIRQADSFACHQK